MKHIFLKIFKEVMIKTWNVNVTNRWKQSHRKFNYCYKNVKTFRGCLWGETPDLGGTRLTWVWYFLSRVYMRKMSHLSEIFFILVSLHVWHYYFHCLFNFLFLFQFPINNYTRLNSTPREKLFGEKSSHLSEISPALRWDLTWVRWICSHINDLLL